MRLDHLLSKEKSRGCVSVKLSWKEQRGPKKELSLSGGDARRGHTRSHPEHDG